MKNKKGYTLAETLITLAVIGVVASIMLPVLRNARPNTEMIMFKKTYYNVSRIVTELINDEDFYPESEDADEDSSGGFSRISISALTGGEEAKFHGNTYYGNSKFCGLFAAKLNIAGNSDPDTICSANVALSSGGNFKTTDGVIWSMPVGSFSSGTEDIVVDVNGERGSNCSPSDQGCNEPDRFKITVGRYGQLTVPEAIAQQYLISSNTTRTYQEFLKCMAAGNCR